MNYKIRNCIALSINIIFSIAIFAGTLYILKHITKEDIFDLAERFGRFSVPLLIIIISLVILMIGLIHQSFNFYIARDKIAYISEHDSLTGLMNITLFKRKLSTAIESGKRFSVIMIDLDNFRSVNNFNSYEIGNFVLRTVAERLSNIQLNFRNEQYTARHSGDKFIILVIDTNQEEDAAWVYCLRQTLCTPIQIPISTSNSNMTLNQKSIMLRASIGIANSGEVDDKNSTDEYFSAIEIALNEAKSLGKNKYVFFTAKMKHEIEEKAQTAKIIESACKKDEFSVVYQPQIDAFTGQIHGYEALIRMTYEKLGPAKFIPIAEEDGHIAKIGRIITEKAIKQIATWRSHGIPLYRVAINYSFGQLEDKGYVNYLKNLMETYNIPSELIGIEITESLFMGNKERAIEVFREFDSIGIKVALDDFGTGYSSLNYLIQLPLEIVKIDKSLVDTYLTENETENDDSSFIKNIVNLVHSLGMKITVEGVEYQWQFEKLRSFGCDYIQGYFFSKPLSGDEIETFIPRNV